MQKKDLEFLTRLVEAPSPSGFEQPAAAVFRDRLVHTADTVETNVMGSVHAVVDSIYPLNDIRAAHERLEGKQQFGKVVIEI